MGTAHIWLAVVALVVLLPGAQAVDIGKAVNKHRSRLHALKTQTQHHADLAALNDIEKRLEEISAKLHQAEVPLGMPSFANVEMHSSTTVRTVNQDKNVRECSAVARCLVDQAAANPDLFLQWFTHCEAQLALELADQPDVADAVHATCNEVVPVDLDDQEEARVRRFVTDGCRLKARTRLLKILTGVQTLKASTRTRLLTTLDGLVTGYNAGVAADPGLTKPLMELYRKVIPYLDAQPQLGWPADASVQLCAPSITVLTAFRGWMTNNCRWRIAQELSHLEVEILAAQLLAAKNWMIHGDRAAFFNLPMTTTMERATAKGRADTEYAMCVKHANALYSLVGTAGADGQACAVFAAPWDANKLGELQANSCVRKLYDYTNLEFLARIQSKRLVSQLPELATKIVTALSAWRRLAPANLDSVAIQTLLDEVKPYLDQVDALPRAGWPIPDQATWTMPGFLIYARSYDETNIKTWLHNDPGVLRTPWQYIRDGDLNPALSLIKQFKTAKACSGAAWTSTADAYAMYQGNLYFEICGAVPAVCPDNAGQFSAAIRARMQMVDDYKVAAYNFERIKLPEILHNQPVVTSVMKKFVYRIMKVAKVLKPTVTLEELFSRIVEGVGGTKGLGGPETPGTKDNIIRALRDGEPNVRVLATLMMNGLYYLSALWSSTIIPALRDRALEQPAVALAPLVDGVWLLAQDTARQEARWTCSSRGQYLTDPAPGTVWSKYIPQNNPWPFGDISMTTASHVGAFEETKCVITPDGYPPRDARSPRPGAQIIFPARADYETQGNWGEGKMILGQNNWEMRDGLEPSRRDAARPDLIPGYVEISRRVGLSMNAGPSSTSLWALLQARMFGFTADEMSALRWALLVWMGPSHDHSFMEIMMAFEEEKATTGAGCCDFAAKVKKNDQDAENGRTTKWRNVHALTLWFSGDDDLLTVRAEDSIVIDGENFARIDMATVRKDPFMELFYKDPAPPIVQLNVVPPPRKQWWPAYYLSAAHYAKVSAWIDSGSVDKPGDYDAIGLLGLPQLCPMPHSTLAARRSVTSSGKLAGEFFIDQLQFDSLWGFQVDVFRRGGQRFDAMYFSFMTAKVAGAAGDANADNAAAEIGWKNDGVICWLKSVLVPNVACAVIDNGAQVGVRMTNRLPDWTAIVEKAQTDPAAAKRLLVTALYHADNKARYWQFLVCMQVAMITFYSTEGYGIINGRSSGWDDPSRLDGSQVYEKLALELRTSKNRDFKDHPEKWDKTPNTVFPLKTNPQNNKVVFNTADPTDKCVLNTYYGRTDKLISSIRLVTRSIGEILQQRTEFRNLLGDNYWRDPPLPVTPFFPRTRTEGAILYRGLGLDSNGAKKGPDWRGIFPSSTFEFISTSRAMHKSYYFAGMGSGATMLAITKHWGGHDIQDYVQFPNEEETLFDMWTQFKVIEACNFDEGIREWVPALPNDSKCPEAFSALTDAENGIVVNVDRTNPAPQFGDGRARTLQKRLTCYVVEQV